MTGSFVTVSTIAVKLKDVSTRAVSIFFTIFILSIIPLIQACAPPQPSRQLAPLAQPANTVAPSLSTQTITPLPTQTDLTPIPTVTPLRPTATPIPIQSATPAPCEDPALPDSHQWCYTSSVGDVFVHPIAFVTDLQRARGYLLDSGRIFSLNLDEPAAPQVILASGAIISDTRVLELLDIELVNDTLLALDRAGDVYRYQIEEASWYLDRYDRPIRDLSSHYFVSLAADNTHRYLLETSYHFGLQYQPESAERLWLVPEGHMVDLTIDDELETFWALYRPYTATVAAISRFKDSVFINLETEIEITRPRQLVSHDNQLYLLDQAGKRLSQLDQSGTVQTQWVLSHPVSSFAVHGRQIILAGRNSLYFIDQPENQTLISSGAFITTDQPNDPQIRSRFSTIRLPIPNLPIAGRDLRLPGAPRHYRLGVHEGIDFYWGPGREIFSVADGTILRLTETYATPAESTFNYWRNQSLTQGYTPEEALDFYRGRQIWIEHDNGLISRYAHLSEINEDLAEGDRVSEGTFIGRVGNSGSPASQEGPAADSHLHFELWLNRYYLGQFMRPIETRELLETLFR